MLFLSYNVHGWIGTDGNSDYSRALEYIRDKNVFAAALQEVIIPHRTDSIAEAHSFIEKCTGMFAVFGKTMLKGEAEYGNVLLTKDMPLKTRLHDITVDKREPRGVIEALLETGSGTVTVLATHLGLKRKERIIQSEMIRDIYRDIDTPAVLMCDSNEWFSFKATKILDDTAGKAFKVRSYPSYFPVFSIDQIRAKDFNADVSTDNGREIRKISDHLPVYAEINMTE